MAKKKRKRVEAESTLVRFLRRNGQWARRLSIAAGLIAVVTAVWIIADPFGGAPTAIDESGREVPVGVIDRAGAAARPGRLAPNFLLPNYDRQAVTLDQFEGRVVLINMWASWCGECEWEMPGIIRVAEQFPDDVVVLLVNMGESKGTAQAWTRSRGFPEDLPNLHWLVDSRQEVTSEYQMRGIPNNIFIERSGVIHQIERQAINYDDVLSSVRSALNENSGASGN